jgi:electron transport complex protein RnfC
MKKLIRIDKPKDIVVPTEKKELYDVDYIYIPLHKNFKPLVDIGDSVSMSQKVATNGDVYLYSSISGKVVSICEGLYHNNKKIKAIRIENNFKEKKVRFDVREIKKLDDLNRLLNNIDDEQLSKRFVVGKVDTLILNLFVDEPFIMNETFYFINNSAEILDTLDLVGKVYKASKILITVKNVDSSNITSLIDFNGMYPNIQIKLLDDLYLLERKDFLCAHMGLDKNRTLVVKPSDLYKIYYAMKYKRKPNTKYVTIVGNNTSTPIVKDIKLYSLALDLMNGIKYETGSQFIKNGLMTGSKITSFNEIIDGNTEALFIMKKEEVKEQKCLYCGACLEVCPMRIDPKRLMDHKITSKRCIDCGLCSYVCPSFINLRKYLKGDKNE